MYRQMYDTDQGLVVNILILTMFFFCLFSCGILGALKQVCDCCCQCIESRKS